MDDSRTLTVIWQDPMELAAKAQSMNSRAFLEATLKDTKDKLLAHGTSTCLIFDLP